MSVVEPGSFLTLHYRLAGPQGDVVNTFGGKPATLSLGAGELSPVVEQRLIGLAEGASLLRISKDEAERYLFWAGRKAAFPAVQASGGRAFFLCTSLRAMRRTQASPAALPKVSL